MSIPAGCAMVFSSDATAAAVTCASMSPDCSPPLVVRNAGSPLSDGSTRRAVRRSLIVASGTSAAARKSAARASGWPWKLPPDTISPDSAKTIGLSVAALASISTTPRANRTASRVAPCTCGAHRIEYASCTRPQCSCDLLIPLPRIKRSMFAADATCPANGRAAWMRGSKGCVEPRSASMDSAAAMSPARTSRSDAATASARSAVDGCVPLISASPSFGPRSIGVRPARLRASAPETRP